LQFEGPRDDHGNRIVLVLPASERFVDCGFRVVELIRGLALIEGRSPGDVIHDILSSPVSICDTEIKAAKLKVHPDCEPALTKLLINAAVVGRAAKSGFNRGSLFACVGEIGEMLAQPKNLSGSNKAKRAVIWRICQKIMALGNAQLDKEEAEKGFWNAARNGYLTDWIMETATSQELDQQRASRAQ
jgi:hypothetical protein